MQQLYKNYIRVRATVLLRQKDGRVCFARHCKDGKRYWLLPGGGQDLGETAKEAAARELKEELNISVKDLKLLFVRETINHETQRHIQFLVFEGIEPDFSHAARGIDERVEGFDFFTAEEIADKPVYPSMKQDIIDHMSGRQVELFKTLEWTD